MEIVQSTKNNNLIFISLQAIIEKLTYVYKTIDESIYQQLFELATSMLQTEAAQDLKTCNTLYHLIAAVYAFYPAALETITQFEPNQLVKIFPKYIDFGCVLKSEPLFEEKAGEQHDLVMQVAENCDPSPDFLDLLRKCFMNYYTPDDPEILVYFLPKIQACTEIPECHPAIAALFEAMMEIDSPNLETEKVEMFWQIIQFSAEFADALISSESVSDLQYGLASFIWDEIMDYEIDDLEVPDELKQQLFQLFNQALTIFVNDLDEFYNLIVIGANKYNSLISLGHSEYWEEIYQFLDTMVEIANNVEDIQCPIFAKAFFDLSDFDVDQFVMNGKNLVDYFLAKVQEPSDGIFYAVASSSTLIRAQVAPQFAALLSQVEGIDCIVYFIEQCAMYAPAQVETYIQVLYSAFQTEPTVGNARIIRKFIGTFPKFFVENSSEVVQPLLEWIPEVEPPVTAQLINGVLSLCMFLGMNETDLGSLLNEMLDVIQASATAIVGEGSIEEINNLVMYVTDLMFPSPMEPNPGENTYIQPPEPVVSFCNQAFERISGVITELWSADNDDIQECLCILLTRALKSNWIQDISIVGSWIESALSVNPVAGHIILLRQIWKHESAQTEGVIGFLNTLPNLSASPNLQIKIMKLFTTLTKKWTAEFYERIDLNSIIPTLSSANEMVVDSALELALSVVQTTTDASFSETILPIVRDCIWNQYPMQIRPKALHVVFEIAATHIEPPTVAAVLLEPIPFRNESTAKIEEVLAAAPEICKVNLNDVSEAINTMSNEVTAIIGQLKTIENASQ